jgi:hypothetical protein
MRLELDDADFIRLNKPQFRAVALMLLHMIGDVKEEEEPAATTLTVTGPQPGSINPPLAPSAVPSHDANGKENGAWVPSAAHGGMVHTPAPLPPPPPPPVPTVTTATAPAISTATSTSAFAIVPPPPPPPPPRDLISSGVIPPPPPLEGEDDDENDGEEGGNVLQGNFPLTGSVPPPPPPSGTGANTAGVPLPPTSTPATGAAGASGVVSAPEYDSAGMQYDARIHQKAKGKKKDGTWKLIKGVDSAVVQAVTAELAAKKANTTQVPLPPNGNTVPVPPVPPPPPASNVPAPPAGTGASVPVPPPPPAGAVGASPYRAFLDKVTELTRANKITPAKVSEICQRHGAPSLSALTSMQHLISDIDASIDATVLGLMA